MMKWLIASGIQSRLVVASIAALLIIFGSLQLRDMQLGVFPEFSPVYVEVQTEALGLSAEEIGTVRFSLSGSIRQARVDRHGFLRSSLQLQAPDTNTSPNRKISRDRNRRSGRERNAPQAKAYRERPRPRVLFSAT